MKTEINEITINGKVYVEKGTENVSTPLKDGMKYQIVRTYSAGVFAGYVESESTEGMNTKCVLRSARRLWSWSGAASLSELATHGTSKPAACKFPCEVDRVELKQVIEILDVTSKARKSISSVAVWTAN
jgi:hypothetical protein